MKPLAMSALRAALLAATALLAHPLTMAQQPAAPTASAAASAAASAPTQPRQLSITAKVWKGDLDQMIERRIVRVLAPHSRSLFYIDKGQERGLSAELARDFERFLNTKYKAQLGKRPITVYLAATGRDDLLPSIVAGTGDIAIGNLTATEARR